MKRAIVVLLLATLTIQIDAQTYVPSSVYIAFTPGLSYTDTVLFDESEIEHYSLYCDNAYVRNYPNDFTRQVFVSIDDVGVGSHVCSLSETVAGVESVESETTSFSLGRRTPETPTNLTVVPGA